MDINLNIEQRMKDFNVAGLSMVVIDKGELMNTKTFGLLEAGSNRSVTNSSAFNACSISKMITSILVMKLTQNGILDLDEDVNLKLQSWKVPQHDWSETTPVTLRTLLSHQAGIIDPKGSFEEWDPHSNSKPVLADILNGNTPYCREAISVKYEPGSDCHYSDAGFCIIQQLVEDVTGTSFPEIVNHHIFKPLRMRNSVYMDSLPFSDNCSCGHDKNGSPVYPKYPIYPYPAAAGLWTTPTDLAVLLMDLFHALQGNSQLGLSADTVQEMISPQGCKKWAGLGVFLDGTDREVEFSSLGWGIGYQSMAVAYPYLHRAVIIMTNTDLGVHQMEGIIGEIYHSIIRS